jgi:hypothetical protein
VKIKVEITMTVTTRPGKPRQPLEAGGVPEESGFARFQTSLVCRPRLTFVLSSRSVYGNLLQQPQEINTNFKPNSSPSITGVWDPCPAQAQVLTPPSYDMCLLASRLHSTHHHSSFSFASLLLVNVSLQVKSESSLLEQSE